MLFVSIRQQQMSKQLRSVARRVWRCLADLLWHRQESCGIAPSDATVDVVDCIYCGPGKPASQEHVIPQAIGGSYHSSDIICEECNSRFGSQVDSHITDWMPIAKARSILGLEGYSGKIPRYEVEATGGQRFVVDRYEKLRPKRSAPVVRQNGEEFEILITGKTRSEALQQAEQWIARKTEQIGHPPLIFERHVSEVTHREWSDLSSDVEYRDDEQGRAIAKMAFHFLATQLDRRFLDTRDFDAIREFVREGKPGACTALAQPAPFAREHEFRGENIRHTLNLHCSRSLRSAVCEVTLFGALDWAVVLSWSYEGPDLHLSLTCDPENHECSVSQAEATPIPASVLLQADEAEISNRFERFESSVTTLVQHLNLAGFLRFVDARIRRLMRELPDKLLQDGDLDGYLALLANRFSDSSHPRALRRFLGLPSGVAAEAIHESMAELGFGSAPTIPEIDARFAWFVYLRLLADSIARLAAIRGASTGESQFPSGNTIVRGQNQAPI